MKTLLIGFTRTDRESNYVPGVHGYRPGAAQKLVMIHVDVKGFENLTGAQWAEAVYVATNAPEAVVAASPPAVAVDQALRAVMDDGVHVRALNKGDTVTCDDETWACHATGWAPIEPDQLLTDVR